MSEDNKTELKRLFAAALLKQPDGDAFKAALTITNDPGTALLASREWIGDPVVSQERLRLLEENGERAFLPTKEDQAKAVYQMACDTHVDPETRLKAHRLYAELLSYIEKPQTGGGNTLINQGVMIVKDHGDDKEWEAKAMRQQTNLTHQGAVIDVQ